MKWSERSMRKKFFTVLLWVCGIAYLALTLLEILGVGAISKAVAPAFLGLFWICASVLQSIKKTAILYFVVAALHFLISFMYLLI